MAKKKSIYEGVSYDTLKDELQDHIEYLKMEPASELKDRIEWKPTTKGGPIPSVISVIEEQLDLQVGIVEKCCRMLKSIYEQEEMTSFVQRNIESMIDKLAEIQLYYRERPITEIEDRFVFEDFPNPKKKGEMKTIRFLANKKESIILKRTTTQEKILKLQPIIKELESFREAVIVKGGSEIPESMMYD